MFLAIPSYHFYFVCGDLQNRPFMSSQIRENYSAEAEAGVHRLVHLRLRALYTYLSLDFFFNCNDVALEGRGHFCRELAKKQCEGAESRLRSHPQMSRVEPWTPWGLALALEKKNSTRPFGTCKMWGPLTLTPQLCDFLENHFLDQEMKLLKKRSDHLTYLLPACILSTMEAPDVKVVCARSEDN